MSAVAARAGVGISALYRRYASKEDLLRQVARDGLARYLEEAEAAVADDGDPWEAFEAFMTRLLDAQTVAITMNLAGTFTPNEELYAMSVRAAELNEPDRRAHEGRWWPAARHRRRRPVADPRAGVDRSASATRRGPASSAAATWRCSSTASGRRRGDAARSGPDPRRARRALVARLEVRPSSVGYGRGGGRA